MRILQMRQCMRAAVALMADGIIKGRALAASVRAPKFILRPHATHPAEDAGCSSGSGRSTFEQA